MFDGCGDDVGGSAKGAAVLQDPVIGFGAAGGEVDFFGVGVYEAGGFFAGCFYGFVGFLTVGTDGGGVAEAVFEPGEGFLDDFGGWRRSPYIGVWAWGASFFMIHTYFYDMLMDNNWFMTDEKIPAVAAEYRDFF